MPRLLAIHCIQSRLADEGIAAPRPVAPPEPLGRGIATIEEMLQGSHVVHRDSGLCLQVAASLYQLVDAARSLSEGAHVGSPIVLSGFEGSLWPEPHDLRFDFEATSLGAEWIDDYASEAQNRLKARSQQSLIGHFDWRVGNLGFTEGKVVAIYDWDSLAVAPEPVIVGCAASQFTADWNDDSQDPIPTMEEMREFVDAYERTRGRSFEKADRELLDAANLWSCAYGARCQHSDVLLGIATNVERDTAWVRLLRERGHSAFLQ